MRGGGDPFPPTPPRQSGPRFPPLGAARSSINTGFRGACDRERLRGPEKSLSMEGGALRAEGVARQFPIHGGTVAALCTCWVYITVRYFVLSALFAQRG